ncbi:MAG: flagellin [Phycisphaerae bacterium]|nr:flagellin [Phycisphaerae bacterium]
MLAIKNNIMAGNAARHLGTAYDSLSRSVERLASGLRINSAKDDAAGLAVRELIRADIAVLQQGARNGQDGISMLQTMEGAMAIIDENLIRMKELAEQAATGSYSSGQRDIMQAEFAEMAEEIDRIAGSTAFNGITMLNDTVVGGSVSIHVGTSTTIDIDKVDMTAAGLGLDTGGGGIEQVVSTAGFASADNVFLTGDGSTFQITFDAGNAGEVDIETAAFANGTDYTLNEVVSAINVASQAEAGYNAASAVYTASSGQWNLKIVHDTSGNVSTTFDDANNVAGMLAANFTNTNGSDGGAITIGGDGSGATAALTAVTTAINTKDTARAGFGYKMNRLESTIAILDIQAENLMSAESRISDVDVATEMAALTRTQVLAQAGIAMLAQANAMPQMALTLLR